MTALICSLPHFQHLPDFNSGAYLNFNYPVFQPATSISADFPQTPESERVIQFVRSKYFLPVSPNCLIFLPCATIPDYPLYGGPLPLAETLAFPPQILHYNDLAGTLAFFRHS
jgi:hypothetical protein